MTLYKQSCKNCGGNLVQLDDRRFKCEYCGGVFTCESVEKHIEELHRLFDESKREAIANARKNLYDAVNAEYISSTHVHECSMALKQLLPDDFQANFYETAIGNIPKKSAKAIRKTDVAENASAIDSMVRFLILSLQSEFVTEVGDLIERAYKGSNLSKYEKYSTELSLEAEKIDNCIYLTSYPRDVFVAYSSKDMDRVLELVECLEEQGFSCFVAARNLRHGRGAVENYDKALREAMDNCTSFVFVSSMNSRHPGCDALKREIPYIKSTDIENSPAELRQDYAGIPQKYKKHRVEYRIEESLRPVAADRIVSEFFAGYERVYSVEEVADRIFNRPVVFDDEADDTTVEQINTKFCISCLAECDEGAETCHACGGTKFASTHMEAELMKELISSRKRTAESEVKATAASGATASSIDSLLKRVFIFLEDEEFDRADDFCEQVLNIDPECAEAYLGKLMVELQVKSRNALGLCDKAFDGNNNYRKILRFGSEEMKNELVGYIKQINDRIVENNRRAEEERLEGLYQQAVKAMNSAKTEAEYKNVAEDFVRIKEYKNCSELFQKCLKLAEEARIATIDDAYWAALRAKNAAKTEVDYVNVAAAFEKIKWYKNSAELLERSLEEAKKMRIEELYQQAVRTMNGAKNEDEYNNAATIFSKIKGYKNSTAFFEKCLVTSEQLVEEKRKMAQMKKKKLKRNAWIISSICIALILLIVFVIVPFRKARNGDFTVLINMYGIEEYQIPSWVTRIEDKAFYGCSSLTSIIISDSVTSIGNYAFCWCTNLETVYYTGTEEQWKKINIGHSNSYLLHAEIIYNYIPEE